MTRYNDARKNRGLVSMYRLKETIVDKPTSV